MAIDFTIQDLMGLDEFAAAAAMQKIAPVFSSAEARSLMASQAFVTVDETGTPRLLAHARAQAVSEWVKRSRFGLHGLIVGSTPPGVQHGEAVRVVRLLDQNTTALVYIDIPIELAELACVVDYGLTQLVGELPLLRHDQHRIDWPPIDGWTVALQMMIGFENVQRSVTGAIDIVSPRSPIGIIRLPLVEMQAGGIDWLEAELGRNGFSVNKPERIPLLKPAELDQERARLEIERADRIFGL